ncbi:MAG: sigma-70 family RNA polymerase sigma factor [Bacteroidota bacterium]|nr:sigma-70 family RNA polymerase sigma factor [Bacteroidota bacterium]
MRKITGSDIEYEQLYKSYFKKFFNYGKKFTKDACLVEDSIQEVFLDAWHKRIKAVEIQSPNSYYFSSFRYILFKKIKQAINTIELDQQDDEPEFSVEQKMIAGEISSEQLMKIQEGLKKLTSRQREAIFLRFYEGLSFEEVAAVLNISVKATYKIMARSLENLRENMSLTLAHLILLMTLPALY